MNDPFLAFGKGFVPVIAVEVVILLALLIGKLA